MASKKASFRFGATMYSTVTKTGPVSGPGSKARRASGQ